LSINFFDLLHYIQMQHSPIVTPLSGPLETKIWPPLDHTARQKLRRLGFFHRLQTWAFSLTHILVFGGFIGGIWNGDIIFTWMFGIGMALALCAILSCYFVYPLLRCPRCRERFFLPSSGLEMFFARVDVTQKACLHCQQPLHPRQ